MCDYRVVEISFEEPSIWRQVADDGQPHNTMRKGQLNCLAEADMYRLPGNTPTWPWTSWPVPSVIRRAAPNGCEVESVELAATGTNVRSGSAVPVLALTPAVLGHLLALEAKST